jgi:DNA-directed RNA polymerase specialized sigma24 family protein
MTRPVMETTSERIERHRAAGTITERGADAMLMHSKGMSYRQIALGLDLSFANVRDRIKRGAQKMELAERRAG